MRRWGKLLVVLLPAALLLTAAVRFVHHTDREYAQWIALYGKSAARLEAHCAELKTSGVCTAARNRRSFVAELQGYHVSVMAWWWLTYVAMLLAWFAVIISLFSVARAFFRRRGAEVDEPTRRTPKN